MKTTGLALINLSKVPFFVSRKDKPDFTAPDPPEISPSNENLTGRTGPECFLV
jgi:hypothetical protein